jgi:hypothetical protein
MIPEDVEIFVSLLAVGLFVAILVKMAQPPNNP